MIGTTSGIAFFVGTIILLLGLSAALMVQRDRATEARDRYRRLLDHLKQDSDRLFRDYEKLLTPTRDHNGRPIAEMERLYAEQLAIAARDHRASADKSDGETEEDLYRCLDAYLAYRGELNLDVGKDQTIRGKE